MKALTVRIIALVLSVVLVFGLAAFFLFVPGSGGRPNANGVAKDTVIIEMNEDYSVTADEFFYYVFMSRDNYIDQYGPEIFDLYPFLELSILSQVDDLLIGNNAFVMWGKEEGFELTEEDLEEFDIQLDDMKASLLASGKRLKTYLKENNLNAELFRRIYLRDAYVEKFLYDYLTPEHPALAVTEAQIGKYIVDKGVLGAKHILFAYDTYESPEKCLLAAQEVLDRLLEGEDFDELMWTYTNDESGLSANPDGYTFRTGEFVPEFEATTKELDIGQMSELVESEYGYHIILRITADTELVKIWVQQVRIEEIRSSYERILDPRPTEARDSLVLGEMKPVV